MLFYGATEHAARGFTLSPHHLVILILRPTWIHILIPQQNPARHALDVLEALLAEDLGELHRTGAAAAVDDDLFALVALDLAEAAADLLQGDQLRTFDVRDLIFVGQAAVDEHELLALVEHRFDLARGDFPIGFERVPLGQAFGVQTADFRLRLGRMLRAGGFLYGFFQRF